MDRSDQELLNNENNINHVVDAGPNGNTTIDEHDDDDDGGDVDGPTVEAQVDLEKIACEYYITQSCRNILTYLYSVPRLSRSYCRRNWTPQPP
jgi:hypothetical protein